MVLVIAVSQSVISVMATAKRKGHLAARKGMRRSGELIGVDGGAL